MYRDDDVTTLWPGLALVATRDDGFRMFFPEERTNASHVIAADEASRNNRALLVVFILPTVKVIYQIV